MSDLQTARLVLHPLTAAEAVRVVTGNPAEGDRWAPGYPFEGDVTGARGFLRVYAEVGDPQPFGAYVIRRREDGFAIGGIGFHGPPDDNGAVVIGYGLIPSERGRGYAAESLRRMLEFARERGIPCVKGDTTHDNVASQRVMTAAGMRLVAADSELRYYEIAWPDASAGEAPQPAGDPG